MRTQECCSTLPFCSISGLRSQAAWRAAPKKWYESGKATANLATGASDDAPAADATAPGAPRPTQEVR